jgi:hypothetical protein
MDMDQPDAPPSRSRDTGEDHGVPFADPSAGHSLAASLGSGHLSVRECQNHRTCRPLGHRYERHHTGQQSSRTWQERVISDCHSLSFDHSSRICTSQQLDYAFIRRRLHLSRLSASTGNNNFMRQRNNISKNFAQPRVQEDQSMSRMMLDFIYSIGKYRASLRSVGIMNNSRILCGGYSRRNSIQASGSATAGWAWSTNIRLAQGELGGASDPSSAVTRQRTHQSEVGRA